MFIISNVPYCILNNQKILYKFNQSNTEKNIFETNLSKLISISYDSDDISTSMMVQFVIEKTNFQNNNLYNTIKTIDNQLIDKYKKLYKSTCIFSENIFEIKIIVSLQKNDYSCSIFDEYYKSRSFYDIKKCRDQYTNCSVRMFIEIFGIIFSPKKKNYELFVRCYELQYFPMMCKKFLSTINDKNKNNINNDLINQNNNLRKQIEVLKNTINYQNIEINKKDLELQDFLNKKDNNPNSNNNEKIKTSCIINEKLLAKNHAIYGKYLKMIEKRVPINAVRQKCLMEGHSINDIEQLINIDPNSHFNNNPFFFVTSFYNSQNVSNNNNCSLDLTTISLKQVDNETLEIFKNKNIKNTDNFLTITVEQIQTQLQKLKKTFFGKAFIFS